MGVHVHAIIEEEWISRAAWSRFYEETLTLLRNWPDPPMRARRRAIAGVDLILYSRDVVGVDSWRVSGDANTRCFAESHSFPRHLGVDEPRPVTPELLSSVANSRRSRNLLGNKTQGYAVHWLVVAVATLAEHRFPGAVIMYGNIDREDVVEARRLLAWILAEEVSWPLCVDEPRLRASLRAELEGDALDEAVSHIIRAHDGAWSSPLLDLLGRASGGGLDLREECVRARSWTSDASPSPDFLAALEEYLKGAQERSMPARFEHMDSHTSLATLALASKRVGLYLTEMAWDEILRASLEELHMLTALAQLQRVNLGVEMSVACFESAFVRKEALRRWRRLRAEAR